MITLPPQSNAVGGCVGTDVPIVFVISAFVRLRSFDVVIGVVHFCIDDDDDGDDAIDFESTKMK